MKSAKAQGTQGREAQKAGDSGGARGKVGRKGKEGKKKTHPKRGQTKPGGGRPKKRDQTVTGKVRRTKTRPGGWPARPGQEEHAHTHARDPGVVSSDLKGGV